MSGSVELSTVESGKKRFPDYAEGMDAETLVFFLTVVETQSLPRAADQLGVSLSSANRMLAKLRRYWDEPLFVRSGFQMMPTESARRRVAGVRSILKTLEVLQSPEAVISPETIRTTVRIAAYDNACAVGIASVLDDFQAKLPQVTFQVFQADGHFFEDLIAGRLDLVFYARQGLAPGLHSMPMFTTPYVIVTVKGHPLEKRVAKKGRVGTGRPGTLPAGARQHAARPVPSAQRPRQRVVQPDRSRQGGGSASLFSRGSLVFGRYGSLRRHSEGGCETLRG